MLPTPLPVELTGLHGMIRSNGSTRRLSHTRLDELRPRSTDSSGKTNSTVDVAQIVLVFGVEQIIMGHERLSIR